MNNQSRLLLASASPRIQAAMQDYLDRVDKGEPIDAEAFLIRHADIADELRSFITVDQQARQLAGAATPKAGSPGPEKIDGKSPQTKAEVSTHSVVGNIDGTVGGKRKTPDVATFAGASLAEPQSLPARKLKDSSIKSRIRRATRKGSNGLLYSCLAAGLFLLLSVIFWIRSGQALVKVEALTDDVQVTFGDEKLLPRNDDRPNLRLSSPPGLLTET